METEPSQREIMTQCVFFQNKMASDQLGLIQQVENFEILPESVVLQNEENEEIVEKAVEAMMKVSPVQIQQEYYENLGDCDWVK